MDSKSKMRLSSSGQSKRRLDEDESEREDEPASADTENAVASESETEDVTTGSETETDGEGDSRQTAQTKDVSVERPSGNNRNSLGKSTASERSFNQVSGGKSYVMQTKRKVLSFKSDQLV